MNRYTKELLEPLVKESTSWAEVCRKLGVLPSTGGATHITNRAKKFGINFSHFTGKVWNKGKRFPPKIPVEQWLVENSSCKSHYLKEKLFKAGKKSRRCEECGIVEWCGEEVVWELDHVNDVHTDCRLENLRILCPNCHALKTRKSRKKKRILP